MDFLYGIALNLLFKFLLDKPPVQYNAPPPCPAYTHKTESRPIIDIPEWVSHVPKNCFVGISKPSPSIEESRNRALNSAISQVLQAMGAKYSVKHKSTRMGNANDSQYELNEQLMYSAKWFLHSIQQNVTRTEFQKNQGNYVCFILMHVTPEDLQKLRKLAIGPKISAGVVNKTNDKIVIRATETNGVAVSLTGYRIQMLQKNRHAKLITLFAYKVPEFSNMNQEGIVDKKISLKGDSEIFSLPFLRHDQSVKEYLLGTETQTKIILRGHDEIGRKISVVVQDPQ